MRRPLRRRGFSEVAREFSIPARVLSEGGTPRNQGGGTQLSHWRAACVHSPGSRSRPAGAVPLSGRYGSLRIVDWFAPRWRIEVTFQDVRARLGGRRAPAVGPRHSARRATAVGTALPGYARRRAVAAGASVRSAFRRPARKVRTDVQRPSRIGASSIRIIFHPIDFHIRGISGTFMRL